MLRKLKCHITLFPANRISFATFHNLEKSGVIHVSMYALKLKKNTPSCPCWTWDIKLCSKSFWKLSVSSANTRNLFRTTPMYLAAFVLLAIVLICSRPRGQHNPETRSSSMQHGISQGDRELITRWLQGMSNEFEAINLKATCIPIYRNESSEAILGYVPLATQRFIFASSAKQACQAKCGLFSHFKHLDGEILLGDRPETIGRYNDQSDVFEFRPASRNYNSNSVKGVPHGSYRRFATCLCEMEKGMFHVSQIFSN